MPRFCVIIPLYNHRDYIAPCLESVLAQTESDWEAIVLDDGSTDGSLDIAADVARRDPRIHIHTQANAGPAAARNRAIGLSGAPWLAFLDSDDLWCPDALAGHLRTMQAQPEAQLTYGRYDRIGRSGVVPVPPRPGHLRRTTVRDLFLEMFLNPSCTAMRRELFDRVGPFRPDLPPVEDYHLFLLAGLHTHYTPTGHVPTLRRRHQANISRGNGLNQAKGARMLADFYREHGAAAGITPQEAAARLSRAHYRAGRTFCRLRRFTDARTELAAAARWRPTWQITLLSTWCWMWAGRPSPEG